MAAGRSLSPTEPEESLRKPVSKYVLLVLPALLLAGLTSGQVHSRPHSVSPSNSAPVSPDELTEPILPELANSTLVTTSTVPASGDVNPYGVAFVPAFFPFGGILFGGPILESDILVSNFNASSNLQGTGSSIVRITPYGLQEPFYQGAPGLGFTTALGAVQGGLVLVGSLPSTDGTCAKTPGPGSILEINRFGQLVGTVSDPGKLINGPWDMTIYEVNGFKSHIFVSNVLSGTVVRLDATVSLFGNVLTIDNEQQIASGYAHRCDPDALVVGPTGVAFDPIKHVLYVASTADNAVYAIPNADSATTDAGKGTAIYQDSAHLRGPLGLVLAPNGNLIAANGDAVNGSSAHPSELIEFTTTGTFVASTSVDTGGQGGAFGIAISGAPGAARFAAVDDVKNTVKVWDVQ